MTKLLQINQQLFHRRFTHSKRGMELVQVAILVAIAVALGIIFRDAITGFVTRVFNSLNGFA